MSKNTMKKYFQILCLLVFFCHSNLCGQVWSAANTGIANLEVRCFAINGNNIFAGTHYNGIFLSADDGDNWQQVSTTSSYTHVYCMANNGAKILAGTDKGIITSNDSGKSWNQINSRFSNTSVLNLAVSGMNIFAATSDSGLFLSSDNGSNWARRDLGFYYNVMCLAANGSNFLAGTNGYGVYLFSNNGSTWLPVNTGMTNAVIYCLASRDTNIYAGTFNGMYLSTDNGKSWTLLKTGISSAGAAYSIVFSGKNLVLGTQNGGVFISTNNGKSWSPINSGLTNIRILNLTATDKWIFAGTYGNGVYKADLNLTAVDEPKKPDKLYFFPNPACDKISLHLTEDFYQDYSLQIINSFGTSVLEKNFYGENNIEIQIADLPAGIYFVALNTEKGAEYFKFLKE